MGMIGMIGTIIPPEVTGPGAVVGSQMGPVVCMMRPVSESASEKEVTEATKACEEVVGVSEEVVDITNKGFETAKEEEEAEIIDQEVGEVVRVSVPISHSVVAVMVTELERAGPVELSQAHRVPQPPPKQLCAPLTRILLQ